MTTTMISLLDQKFLSLAAHEASKSKVLMRHGCVAVVNGKVLSKGYNNYRTQSKDQFLKDTCSCHAEVDTIRHLYNTYTNTYGKYSDSIKVAYQ